MEGITANNWPCKSPTAFPLPGETASGRGWIRTHLSEVDSPFGELQVDADLANEQEILTS